MNNVLTILQNSYDVTDIRVTSHLCLTNQHSNTAFRGFGAPQIMLATDEIMDHIADELHLPAEQVSGLLTLLTLILLITIIVFSMFC